MSSETLARQARVLQLRAAGFTYPQIAEQTHTSVAVARSDARRALADVAEGMETAERSAALEMEKLDGLERRAQTVLTRSASRNAHLMVLRAVDRLLAISERRAATAIGGRGGAVEMATAAQLALLPARIRASAAGQTALLLARRMDAGLPPPDLTAAARELRVTVAALVASAPTEEETSKRDELRERREQRIAAELAAAAEQ